MTNPAHAEFEKTGDRLAYYRDDDRRSVYDIRWTHLFIPSAAAKRWDGAPVGTTHCVWSDAGSCYVYVAIKETGRKRTRVPGTGFLGEDGVRVRVTLNGGTDDETTVSGWVVDKSMYAGSSCLLYTSDAADE